MTNALRDLAIATTASLPASILIKVTLALALALAAVHLGRRSRASVRHAVLLAAFAVMLVLPLTAAFAPGVTIAMPVARSGGPATVFEPAPASTPDDLTALPDASAPLAQHAVHSWPLPSTTAMLLGLWVIGAVFAFVPVLAGLWQVRSLRRTGLPWSASRALVSAIATGSSHDRADILLHERIAGPVACGVWRHAILLPRDADQWSADDLQRALVHELEHVRRRDWISQCVARALCAVYWFHPLAWAAWRRLTIEAERACDDAVLQQTDPIAYADQLVALASRLSDARPSPALAMANRRDLATRVRAVLDDRQQRGPVNGRAIAGAAIAGGMLVIGLGPVRVTAGPAPQVGASDDARPRFDVASIRPCESNAPGHGRGGSTGTASPGRLRIDCQPLLSLVRTAYQVYADGHVNAPATYPTLEPEIAKAPEWMRTTRFTIEAVTSQTPAPAITQGPMLQTLLEERFKLKVHRETRDVPIRELVVAKGGAKLTPFKPGTCVPYTWSVSPQPPLEAGQRRCENISAERDADGNWVQIAEALTLDDVAVGMGGPGRTPVVNNTGITGLVSFRLTYSDSYETALKDQLGLELRPTKGPQTFLVIDHAEPPAADGGADGKKSIGNSLTAGESAPGSVTPKFDVVSVKPCAKGTSPIVGRGAGPGAGGVRASAGTLDADCQTPADLIRFAYLRYADGKPWPISAFGFRDPPVSPRALMQDLEGSPAWVNSDRYTIATTAATVQPTEMVMGPMLQAILEDRFKLKIHRETRDVPIYELTVAKGALKLRPSQEGSCVPFRDRSTVGPPSVGDPKLCGLFYRSETNSGIDTYGQTMAALAEEFSGWLDRDVVDKTGIPGTFDVHLEIPSEDPSWPDARSALVDALLERLGLKLQSAKGQGQFLVIDHVERPSEN